VSQWAGLNNMTRLHRKGNVDQLGHTSRRWPTRILQEGRGEMIYSPHPYNLAISSPHPLQSWKWRQYIAPKRSHPTTGLHSVITQKTACNVNSTTVWIRTGVLTARHWTLAQRIPRLSTGQIQVHSPLLTDWHSHLHQRRNIGSVETVPPPPNGVQGSCQVVGALC
jgi:hypothetical protein